jgi:hypothetical protein
MHKKLANVAEVMDADGAVVMDADGAVREIE